MIGSFFFAAKLLADVASEFPSETPPGNSFD
jgi:hypothetical protein